MAVAAAMLVLLLAGELHPSPERQACSHRLDSSSS